ncbi:MAG: DUF4097 domain-containing protein [Propionibacteriaceae bacterium]|nr:DUF4097 domain-containing protein [Propionibacteriaceae bacterium]
MKKAWSIIWKVALACGVLGIALMVVGLTRGWPNAISFDRHGTHVAVPRDIDVDETVATFTAIDVNVSICDVRVVTGAHYGVVIHWPNTTRDITWTSDGSTLQIKETGPSMVMQWLSSSCVTTVTAPADSKLTNINVTSSTGNVSVDVAADRMVLQDSTGDIRLSADAATQADLISSTGSVTVTADVANLTASSSTGDVAAEGHFSVVKATSSTGGVSVSGSAGSVQVSSSTGDVRLTLNSPWDAVSYYFHTDTGRITVAGPGSPYFGGGSGPHQMRSPANLSQSDYFEVGSSTGDIYVTLGG